MCGLEGCNLLGWPLDPWHLSLRLVICLSSLSTALQYFTVRCSEHKRALCFAAGQLLLHLYTVAHIMELNPSVSILAGVSSILSHGYANGLQSICLHCMQHHASEIRGAGDWHWHVSEICIILMEHTDLSLDLHLEILPLLWSEEAPYPAVSYSKRKIITLSKVPSPWSPPWGTVDWVPIA